MSNKKINRILIGSEEICGFIAQFSGYYKSKGYSVVSIATKNKFFSHQYDINPDNFIEGWKKYSTKNIIIKTLISYLFHLLRSKYQQAILWRLKRNFISEFDLYINVWKCFIDEEIAFKAAKKNGTKWATVIMGDDFRNRWVFQNNFNIDDNLLSGVNKDQKHIMDRLKRIRLHEKHANAIFSVPDQSSLSLRPYFHLQISVKLDEIKFHLPTNAKLKIVHCPSDTNLKGTPIIEKAINEIIEEGFEVEFLNIRNVPHSELMTILSESDILVDELVLHGPGYLSFEAMASGCAVLTKYYENSPNCFRPPIISITKDNLKEKLKNLIIDREKIKAIASAGRKYVEENNTLEKVADYFMSCLNNKNGFDYYPDYFRNEFNPDNYALTPIEINKTTDTVKNCDWYIKHVKPGTNGKLNF